MSEGPWDENGVPVAILHKNLKAARDRIAALEQHVSELERSLENARKERDVAEAQVQECGKRWSAEESRAVRAEQERDEALADNAALVEQIRRTRQEGKYTSDGWWSASEDADALFAVLAQPHFGAALLEEHRKEVDGLLKEIGTLDGKRMQAQRAAQNGQSALHNVLEKLREDLARHGVQCVEGGLVGILNGIDRVAVRARNEGRSSALLEVQRARAKAVQPSEAFALLTYALDCINALKEGES